MRMPQKLWTIVFEDGTETQAIQSDRPDAEEFARNYNRKWDADKVVAEIKAEEK